MKKTRFNVMRKYLILIITISFLTACYGTKSLRTSEYNKSPQEVGKLVTDDLLSRPQFIMYSTPGVSAVHYAEACAAFGAIKLAGYLKDKETVRKLALDTGPFFHGNGICLKFRKINEITSVVLCAYKGINNRILRLWHKNIEF